MSTPLDPTSNKPIEKQDFKLTWKSDLKKEELENKIKDLSKKLPQQSNPPDKQYKKDLFNEKKSVEIKPVEIKKDDDKFSNLKDEDNSNNFEETVPTPKKEGVRFAEETKMRTLGGTEETKAKTKFDDPVILNRTAQKFRDYHGLKSAPKGPKRHSLKTFQDLAKEADGGNLTQLEQSAKESLNVAASVHGRKIGRRISKNPAGFIALELINVLNQRKKPQNLTELKAELKAAIHDKNIKRERLGEESFKIVEGSSVAVPSPLQQSKEYPKEWKPGEIRSFTLEEISKEDLPIWDKIIDEFFNDQHVKIVLEKHLTI